MEKKTYIYYFSGTGNSLAAARQLAAQIPDSEMIRITEEIQIKAGERVGFVFPCYYGRMPRVVQRMAEQMQVDQATYYFAVVTAGFSGRTPYIMLDEILKDKGVSLSYGKHVGMPSNYVIKYNVWGSDKIRKNIAAAEEKINQIADDIRQKKQIKIPWFKFYANNLQRDTEKLDHAFYALESCNGCGVCKAVCPIGNIKMTEHKPQWQHRCEHCMACIHWCPQKAIQYGDKTLARGRYHHPDVSYAEFSSDSI